jgi:hypothetical protein
MWSVGLEAEADHVMTREEIVELADAVAVCHGIASGIGKELFGATLLVEADDREAAIATATSRFLDAMTRAGFPVSPIVRIEAVGEDEPDDSQGYIL